MLVQPVQTECFVPVLLQLLHELAALFNPLFRELCALILFALILLQFVFNVEQAAAELAQDVLWQRCRGWLVEVRQLRNQSHANGRAGTAR